MNPLTCLLTGVFAMSLACANALAADVSYDFLEVRYLDTEIDDIDVDGDGLVFNASYNVTGNWLLVGGVTALDFDRNVDASSVSIGGGYVFPVNDQFDLFATGSIVRTEVDVGDSSNSDTGFALVGGLRTKFNAQLEGRAQLRYVDVDDSDISILLGGDFYFTPAFAAGVTLEFSDENDALTIGGRWFFGPRKVRPLTR